MSFPNSAPILESIFFPSGLTRMRVGYKPIPYFSSSGVGFWWIFARFYKKAESYAFHAAFECGGFNILDGGFFQGSGK